VTGTITTFLGYFVSYEKKEALWIRYLGAYSFSS